MKNMFVIAMAMVLVPALASADGWQVFDGGWRLSAGAAYDSGVKTDMKFMPQQVYRSPLSITPGAMTRAQAEAAAKGQQSGTKTTYVNTRHGNAESWVDTNDPATGHDAGMTENYKFVPEVWNGESNFELGYAEWEELESRQASFASMESFASDEGAMPGINIELSRNFYHDVDWGWGFDLAFVFQYSRRNRAVRMGGGRGAWEIGSSRKNTGGYQTDYNATGDFAELLTYQGAGSEYIHDYVWSHPDGEYVGSGGNPESDACPIDSADIISSEWENGGSGDLTEYGMLNAEGDYEDLELMLLARPYYDVFDWLRINSMIGIVASRQEMEMSFTMFRNGAIDYRSNRDFSQWDVYGVAGLGLMLYYNDFTLGADFMARFLDNDMDISDRYYSGSVRRGRWMFRVNAGYEF